MKQPMDDVLKLPYQKFELYKRVKFGKNFSDNKYTFWIYPIIIFKTRGIIISGVPTGAFIKGLVRITSKSVEPEKGSRSYSQKSATTCSVIYKSILLFKDNNLLIIIRSQCRQRLSL